MNQRVLRPLTRGPQGQPSPLRTPHSRPGVQGIFPTSCGQAPDGWPVVHHCMATAFCFPWGCCSVFSASSLPLVRNPGTSLYTCAMSRHPSRPIPRILCLPILLGLFCGASHTPFSVPSPSPFFPFLWPSWPPATLWRGHTQRERGGGETKKQKKKRKKTTSPAGGRKAHNEQAAEEREGANGAEEGPRVACKKKKPQVTRWGKGTGTGGSGGGARKKGPQQVRKETHHRNERGAGREQPVLGARNGPQMDEDPVGPRQRVAGGPVGYKHGMIGKGDGTEKGVWLGAPTSALLWSSGHGSPRCSAPVPSPPLGVLLGDPRPCQGGAPPSLLSPLFPLFSPLPSPSSAVSRPPSYRYSPAPCALCWSSTRQGCISRALTRPSVSALSSVL